MNHNIKAGENIQSVVNKAKNGDTITLLSGCHRPGAEIEVKNKHNIKFRGEKGTVISGSITAKCEWKKYSENIFAASVSKGLDVQAIFVNGEKYIMARYPNYKESAILNGYSKSAVSPDKVKGWKNPKGAYVHALHSFEWGGNSFVAEGKTADNTLSLKWIGDNNRGHDFHKDYVMIENVFEELDDEKEWFYDKDEGIIYLIPESDTDLLNAKIELSVCGELFKFIDCSNITIENIKFSKTKRMMFCSKYIKITRSDWSIAENGAVYIKGCKNITLKNCTFYEIGGNCVFIHNKNKNCLLLGCDFSYCGASGVCIIGNQKSVRDLSTWENHKTKIADKVQGAIGDDFPCDITVSDCYFYRLGEYEKQSAAVTVSVALGVKVLGSTIHHMPRAGISICDGSFGGHLIEGNLVFDTIRETGDHGPFNSWGRDRFWSYGGFDTSGGKGKEKRRYALLDATETTVIAKNMFVGTRGFGIDLDDGSSNYLITKNYCHGVGIKLREGFLRTACNNFIVNAPLDLHCTFAKNDDVIENNIIISEKPLSIIAQNKGFTTIMRNNLFVGASEEVLSNEIFYDYKNYVCKANDKHALSMNPKEIYFEKFDLSFGRKDKPKPKFSDKDMENLPQIEVLKAVFTVIDDSIRSMGGLSDYKGAFVKSALPCSPFYALGVREDDVILKLNETNINSPDDIKKVNNLTSALVNRKQKIINLEA